MIEDFSYDALKQRGWQQWDKPDKQGGILMLCPLEDFVNVPQGIVMDSIMGDRQYVKGLDEIDTDTRGGVMAFGITVNTETITPEKAAELLDHAGRPYWIPGMNDEEPEDFSEELVSAIQKVINAVKAQNKDQPTIDEELKKI